VGAVDRPRGLLTFGGLLAGTAVTALRLSARRRGIVLVYHAIAERPGDVTREIAPAHGAAQLRQHLRHLRRWYRIVEAAELLDAVVSRRRGGRFPVAVTFDDDLASHVRTALPILRDERVRATFFLCGASLDGPRSFWWERLQRAVDAGKADIPELAALNVGQGARELAARIETLPARRRAEVSDALRARLGADPPDAGLRVAQVLELSTGAGMSIGFHTLRHDMLTALGDDELRASLTDGRSELESIVGVPLAAIAYPHGRADARVAEAARTAGFRRGFTGAQRAVGPGTDPLLVPRVEPPRRSLPHFALTLVRRLLDADGAA
jgi:peptidoglycan/xylan/chitin deacetylase (PgdA/CDA1 family)